MKYEELKKRTLIETGIIAAVVIVMSAVIYIIGSISDDYEEGNKSLQQQVDNIDQEMNKLKGRFSNMQKNMDVYQELEKKMVENRLAIDRKVILEKFNGFKTQYGLSNLHLTVASPQLVQDGPFKRPTSNVNFIDVVATFELLSDEGVYQLIVSLRDELPGLTKLVKLSLSQQKTFNDQAIRELSQKGVYPMVKAEVHFIWFGLNVIVPPDSKTPGGPNASPNNMPNNLPNNPPNAFPNNGPQN